MSYLKLADFLPAYPSINDNPNRSDLFKPYGNEGFYSVIRRKKEFSELQLVSDEKKPSKPGEELPHQTFVARFFNPHTPYQSGLIFRAVGTGKTCAGTALIELTKRIRESRDSRPGGSSDKLKPAVWLVRPSLKRSLISTIVNKCTAGQYIPKELEELKGKERARLIRTNKLLFKDIEVLTYREAALILNGKSDGWVTENYSNRIVVIDEVHNVKNRGKEKIVLSSSFSAERGERNSKRNVVPVDVYREIWRLTHTPKNIKVLLMTATPMRDEPQELADVLNLLLPDSTGPNNPVDKNTFLARYYDPVNSSLVNTNELRNYFKGRVSYLRANEKVRRLYRGSDILTLPDVPPSVSCVVTTPGERSAGIRVAECEMLPFQLSHYIRAYLKETGGGLGAPGELTPPGGDEVEREENDIKRSKHDEGGSGVYVNSREASLFVYPNDSTSLFSSSQSAEGGGGLFGREGFKKFMKGEKHSAKTGKRVPHYRLDPVIRDILTDNGRARPPEILERIRMCSAKYYRVLRNILENPRKCFFVYINIVNGSGARLFGELLSLFNGFTQYHGEGLIGPGRRYAVLTGTTETSKTTEKIIEYFNRGPALAGKPSEKSLNLHGDYLQVIIGSRVVGEGISFEHMNVVELVTGHWNDTEMEQAIGRAIRAFSHDELPVGERVVEIDRLAAVLPRKEENVNGLKSIDLYLYKIASDKDRKIRPVLRLMKEMAVDCSLNRARNIRPTDVNGSQDCDYRECDYKCPASGEIKSGDLITDTFDLYYAVGEMNEMIEKIRLMFRHKSHYTISELVNVLNSQPPTSGVEISSRRRVEYSVMFILKCLNDIINRSVRLYNRYGFPAYLKHESNLFFLVDGIELPSQFTLNYYASNPRGTRPFSFVDIVDGLELQHFNGIADSLVRLTSDSSVPCEVTTELINSKLSLLSEVVREKLMGAAVVAQNTNQSQNIPFREYLLHYFQNFIVAQSPVQLVSRLVPHKERCLSLTVLPTSTFGEFQKTLFNWEDCSQTVREGLKRSRSVKKEELIGATNPFKFFGVMKRPRKGSGPPYFSIRWVETEEQIHGKMSKIKEGRSKKGTTTGERCSTVHEGTLKKAVFNVLTSPEAEKLKYKLSSPVIDKEVDNRFEKYSREININSLKGLDFAVLQPFLTPEKLKGYTDEKIAELIAWGDTARKAVICEALERWTRENGYLEIETLD